MTLPSCLSVSCRVLLFGRLPEVEIRSGAVGPCSVYSFPSNLISSRLLVAGWTMDKPFSYGCISQTDGELCFSLLPSQVPARPFAPVILEYTSSFSTVDPSGLVLVVRIVILFPSGDLFAAHNNENTRRMSSLSTGPWNATAALLLWDIVDLQAKTPIQNIAEGVERDLVPHEERGADS